VSRPERHSVGRVALATDGGSSTPTDRLRRWLELPQATSPAVASDGTTVLYLSDESGYLQPWAVPRTGGTSRRLRATPERVGALLPSPKGPGVVLFGDVGGNEHWQLRLLDLEEPNAPLIELTRAPATVHGSATWDSGGERLFYTSNARDPRFFDVFSLNPGRPEPPQCWLAEDSYLTVLDARDGRLLVGRNRTNLDVELLLLSRDGPPRLLNPHAGEQSVLAAGVGSDAVYAAANPQRERTALMRLREGTAGPEFLREYAGDVELLRVAPDGRGVLLSVNREGWSETHFFDPGTGEDRPLLSGPKGVVGSLSFLPDGTGYVYDVSYSEGHDVFYRSLETGKEKRLTRPRNPLPAHPVEPRLGSIRASDGVSVPYLEYARPDRPSRGTVLYVHGGPESQARPAFAPLVQFLVGEGWRVVAPNVRGSSGYGRTFLHLDDGRLRMDSVRDLRELVDSLERLGKAPRGRVVVAGGSYGGFMVLASLTTYPELFAAGIDIVGIANFLTFLEKTGPWRRALREAEYGSLTRDREFLRELSPLFHADRIRAPLLVVHGRNDPRVPFAEAEQIVSTLRRLGRPVELLEFGDEGHGLHRREHLLQTWSKAVEFLDRYLPSPTKAPDGDAPDR